MFAFELEASLLPLRYHKPAFDVLLQLPPTYSTAKRGYMPYKVIKLKLDFVGGILPRDPLKRSERKASTEGRKRGGSSVAVKTPQASRRRVAPGTADIQHRSGLAVISLITDKH